MASTELDATTKRWTLIAAVLGSGIVFLDSTVVNVALPKIGEDLHSSLFSTLEGQTYVYNGYLLTLSALLILAGALSDYYGRKRMFALGLAGFGITSVLCGLAPNMELLILFRILQGATGALLVPGALALINSTFRGEELGRAFGVWAGASAATTILGPFVGGLLVDTISWRAVFFINVPLIALAYYATVRHVQESRDEDMVRKFDWLGAGVVALAVGGLAFGAIRGQQRNWQDVTAFIALGVGAVATVAFPFLERRTAHPLVPLELFRSRNFTVTNISTLVIYGALYVTFYFLTLFLQGTLGYNAAAAGIAGVPGTLFLVLFSTRFGKLAARYGPRMFMSVGPAIMALGVLWYTRVPAHSQAWVLSTGEGGRILPPVDYFTDFLPGLVLFIAASFYAGLASRVPGLNPDAQGLRERVAPLNQPTGRPLPGGGHTPVAPRLIAGARGASTDSFHLAMYLGAGLLFAGAAVNAVGIKNPPRRAAELPPEQVEPVPVPCGGCLAEREVTAGTAPPAET